MLSNVMWCCQLIFCLNVCSNSLNSASIETHTHARTHAHTHTHTHTHPFNGPFSGTTRISRYQKGKTNLDFTEARDSEWQLHQLGHMQVCISLQTDNHASTPPLSFYRTMLCIRGTSHGPVSVCPSVTSRRSTKTAKRSITQTTPHDSPGTLVFWYQRSPRNSTGVNPYEGAECRWGGSKSTTFDKYLAISRNR